MCMKDYGAKKNIGKIRIIHLIGQKGVLLEGAYAYVWEY